MNFSSEIKFSVLISYFTIGFSIVSGIFFTPWLIGKLGLSEYGLYILVTSFLSYFIMDFGIGQSISKLIAKSRVNSNYSSNDILGLSLKIYLLIDCILLIAFFTIYFFIENIYKGLSYAEIERFKTIYLLAGIFSLISLPFLPLNGLLIAYEKLIVLRIGDLINKVLSILLIVFFLNRGYDLFSVVLINCIVSIIVVLFKLYFLSKARLLSINFRYKSREILFEIWTSSLWISIISIAQRFFFLITPSLLAIFSNTKQISIFSIIVIIEGYVWTFSNALNGVFIAHISRIVNLDNKKQLINDLFVKIGRIQLLTSGFLVLSILTFGKEFIVIWLGESFLEAYFGLCFIIVVSFVTLTQDVAQTYLFVANKIKYRAYSLLFGAVLSLVFSILLIPKHGAFGAAIAIFIGMTFSQVVLMNFVYKKQISLDVVKFFKLVHLKFFLPFISLFIVGWLIKSLLPIHTFYQLFFHGIFFTVLYLAVSWFWILNDNEKNYISNTVIFKSRFIGSK